MKDRYKNIKKEFYEYLRYTLDKHKSFTFHSIFKLAEKDYFKDKEFTSLHTFYKYEKNSAGKAFKNIYNEASNIYWVGAQLSEKEQVKPGKKKTKPKTGRTQKTINIRRKIRKEYYLLKEVKGYQPRKAKEMLAKKYGYTVSTINTYLNEKYP